jgi:predicted dehydrogenase
MQHYATLDELFADSSVTLDGVMICTPTATHAELVKSPYRSKMHSNRVFESLKI